MNTYILNTKLNQMIKYIRNHNNLDNEMLDKLNNCLNANVSSVCVNTVNNDNNIKTIITICYDRYKTLSELLNI